MIRVYNKMKKKKSEQRADLTLTAPYSFAVNLEMCKNVQHKIVRTKRIVILKRIRGQLDGFRTHAVHNIVVTAEK